VEEWTKEDTGGKKSSHPKEIEANKKKRIAHTIYKNSKQTRTETRRARIKNNKTKRHKP